MMPKRFTATEKWDDPFFLRLPVIYKAFWAMLCDRCDHAGFWQGEESIVRAMLRLGDKENFSLKEALSFFGDRVQVMPDGKWWLTRFIEFQYKGRLTRRVKPQLGVLELLEKNGVDTSIYETFNKGLDNPLQRVQDKDKDKDRSSLKDLDLSEGEKGFEKFWSAYPRKEGGRPKALIAWIKAKPPLEVVLKALNWQRRSRQWLKDDGDFIPHPSTYLNQRRWEDVQAGQPGAAPRTFSTPEDAYQDLVRKCQREKWHVPTFEEWKKAKEEDGK